GLITGTVQANPHAVLGLATGSTPIGIYQEMISLYKQDLVSYRHAATFNLDEYLGLAPDHPQSYAYYMKKQLFDHIDIQTDNAHIPNGLSERPEDECAQYDAALAASGGIDLQLLGIGHNGHIGFNE